MWSRGQVLREEGEEKRSSREGRFTLKTLISIVCPCLIFHKQGMMLERESDHEPAVSE